MQAKAPRPRFGGVEYPGLAPPRGRGGRSRSTASRQRPTSASPGRRSRPAHGARAAIAWSAPAHGPATSGGEARDREIDCRIDLHPQRRGRRVPRSRLLATFLGIPLVRSSRVRAENLLSGRLNHGVTHITDGAYRVTPVEWSVYEWVGCSRRSATASAACRGRCAPGLAPRRVYRRLVTRGHRCGFKPALNGQEADRRATACRRAGDRATMSRGWSVERGAPLQRARDLDGVSRARRSRSIRRQVLSQAQSAQALLYVPLALLAPAEPDRRGPAGSRVGFGPAVITSITTPFLSPRSSPATAHFGGL